MLKSNKSFFFIVRNHCFKKVVLINNPLDLNFKNTESDIHKTLHTNTLRGSILDEKSGLCSHERGNKTDLSMVARFAHKSYGLTKRVANSQIYR
ncbi:hypothetical protein [Helicobacter sp. T3_23-1056]